MTDRLTHAETGDVLATDVATADSWYSKGRGLIGETHLPEGYALVFPFDDARPRTVHMLGVRTAIDVLWLVDETVERVATLPAWRGLARAPADTIIELPPGAAAAVTAGDRVVGRE